MSEIIVKKSRKELWMWRIVFIAAIGYAFVKKDPNEKIEIKEDSIISTSLNQQIFYDEQLIKNIYELADNDKVKGVLLKINCPGGDMTGSEAIYRALNDVKSKKPLVVSVQTDSESGCYMASLAANKIYGYESSTIGSIGVISGPGFVDVSGLEEKLGIKFFNYKSSPLKAIPDTYEILGFGVNKKPDEEGEKYLQGLISEFHDIFKDMVRKNRPQIKDVDAIANGKEFTGRKSLELGLIDAIGTERDALKDLQTNFNLKADLPVVDYDIVPFKEEKSGFFSKALGIAKVLIK